MIRIILLIFVCSGIVITSTSGQTVTVKRAPIIRSGQSQANGIPYTSDTPNTLILKGETEVVLGPDNSSTVNDQFSTNGYMDNANGYFHALLVPPLAYADLKNKLDGSYCEVSDNLLLFKYVEKYVEGPLNYQIYDYQRNTKVSKPITLPDLILTKKVGDNYFTLDLSKVGTFINVSEEASYYVLEVTNEKNEKTLLRFRYNP